VSRGVTVRSTLSHPHLQVTRCQALSKDRVLYQITGVTPRRTLGIFNANIDTLECSLLERVYFCKVDGQFVAAPSVNVIHVEHELRDFRNALLSRSRNVTPFTIDEVVDTYRGRKRTLYENARRDLEASGLSRKHAQSICFVKVEKGNTAKAPRAIQPRKPVYNLVVGKYIKAIEHRMYRWIGGVFGDGPTVMKGYNVQQVARIIEGKWKSFNKPVAIGLDATKFDMHVSPAILGWEHGIYKRIFSTYPELKELLDWQMNNRGSGYCPDGKLTYKVRGKRFSGDMNTALGNCLIMCAMVWAYAKSRGVSVKLVNNGDDCVVFMEEVDVNTFSAGLDEWFLKMGFRMTIETPVYELSKIEFCQMRPIYTANGITMVRNIPTALEKDSCCVIDITQQQVARTWMAAVGEGGISLCRGVPIMQSFYRAYVRNGSNPGKMRNSPQFVTGMSMMAHGLEGENEVITDEARLSVFTAWGITPDEQIVIENHYEKWAYDGGAVDIEDVPITLNVLCLPW
jgi:hypothetical protein